LNGPPYPDTRGLVEALRRQTPPDLQYMITDMFETITLYDNKAVSAKVEPTADHKYKVTLIVDARKMRANGEGAETQIPIHDLIEVGVFKARKTASSPCTPRRCGSPSRARSSRSSSTSRPPAPPLTL